MDITHEKLSEGFTDFIVASVAIKSTPERLYKFLTDISNLSEFFPQIEFKLDSHTPIEVGSIYYTRQMGTKNWTAYRVLTLEHNFKMSAEIYGKDRLFEALRYEHKFVTEGDKTISYEKVDYKFRFGIVGRLLNLLIGKKLVRKQVLDAHLKLKEKAERL